LAVVAQLGLGEIDDTGFEHNAKPPEIPIDANQGGAESGAVLPSAATPLPSALMEIITGWSRLPATVQEAILAIIRATI
jgi:hypothetical protein